MSVFRTYSGVFLIAVFRVEQYGSGLETDGRKEERFVTSKVFHDVAPIRGVVFENGGADSSFRESYGAVRCGAD